MRISNIRGILQGSMTALESLLKVVEFHMLVPDDEKRSLSADVHKSLAEIYSMAENDARYLISPKVELRARTNPPWLSRESLSHRPPWGSQE